MKNIFKNCFVPAIVSGVLLTSACSAIDPNTAIDIGLNAVSILSTSDEDMAAMSDEVCREMDRKNYIFPPHTPEAKRISRIAGMLDEKLEGRSLNFKVYRADKFNAFALANGCIRVNSAQLSQFTDEELASVIGHEIGHVRLKHSKNQFRTMGALNVALQAGSVLANKSSVLNSSLFQKLVFNLTNGQYSQKQELEADAYAIGMLKRRHLNPYALISMLKKLGKLYGDDSSSGPMAYFSSHPNNQTRINAALSHINQRQSSRTNSRGLQNNARLNNTPK